MAFSGVAKQMRSNVSGDYLSLKSCRTFSCSQKFPSTHSHQCPVSFLFFFHSGLKSITYNFNVFFKTIVLSWSLNLLWGVFSIYPCPPTNWLNVPQQVALRPEAFCLWKLKAQISELQNVIWSLLMFCLELPGDFSPVSQHLKGASSFRRLVVRLRFASFSLQT